MMSDASAMNSRTDLSPVAEAVTDGLIRTNPSERYMPAGLFWKLLVFMFQIVPAAFMDHALRSAQWELIKKIPVNKSKVD